MQSLLKWNFQDFLKIKNHALFSIIDIKSPYKLAKSGLEKARALGAKEDELRLLVLLQTIKSY